MVRRMVSMAAVFVAAICLRCCSVDASKDQEDRVRLALEYVERVARSPCTGGTEETLHLKFDPAVWPSYAEVAVRLGNLIMRLLYEDALPSDHVQFALVAASVQGSSWIFGSALAYETEVLVNRTIFCPYAHRKNGTVVTHDIALNYDYLAADTEWYAILRAQNWSNIPLANYLMKDPNDAITQFQVPAANLSHGHWTFPYFDCGGGDVWMVTFSSPLLTADEDHRFLGVATIDVEMTNIDINQCDSASGTDHSFDIFLGSHHCHQETTSCVFVSHRGFRRGAYTCHCRDGFYPPNGTNFDGFEIEEFFARNLSSADTTHPYQCLPCAEGCTTCVDDRPCMHPMNFLLRLLLIVLAGMQIIICIVAITYIFTKRMERPIKAGSPIFLSLMCFGCILMVSKVIVRFFTPVWYLCHLAYWCEFLGFSVLFGALLLKTWRISALVTITNAKGTTITDFVLLQRFLPLPLITAAALAAWTAAAPEKIVIRVTRVNLKFYDCATSWSLLAAHGGEALLLLWGVYLCFRVRKAPSAFNESRFITWAIYNAVLTGNFLLVITYFMLVQEGPDLVLAMELVRIVVVGLSTVAIILIPKIYAVSHPTSPTLAQNLKSKLAEARSAAVYTIAGALANRKSQATQTDESGFRMNLEEAFSGIYMGDSETSAKPSEDFTDLSQLNATEDDSRVQSEPL